MASDTPFVGSSAVLVSSDHIAAGTYKDSDYDRVLLPALITMIEDGAFAADVKCTFWCVKGSYAAARIAELCPSSTLELFASELSMEDSWKNYDSLKNTWKKIRSEVSDKEIYQLMDMTGWSYEEASARFEKEFLKSGISFKKYLAIEWRDWYKQHPDKDTAHTWIDWRKTEVAKIEASLQGGKADLDFNTDTVAPRRMTAARYASIRKLGEEIRNRAITLDTLCTFLDLPIPEILEDKKNVTTPTLAFYLNQIISGGIYFCRRDKGISVSIAKKAGVLCVIGSSKYRAPYETAGIPYIDCASLEAKLMEVAALWRSQFPNTKTVCITGSVGKTTTTEMINNVALSSFKSQCIWVNKNLPIQAAWYTQALDDETGVYVQEASGASVGLMERTSRLLSPDIFVVTNVGNGHIGKHGGSRMSLLYEKITCDRRAPEGALGVLNYDDDLLRKASYIHEIAWFSLKNPEADYHAENIKEADGIISFNVVEKNGIVTPMEIHAIGIHNIYDALSAFAVGVRLGIERSVIANAIGAYRSQGVRQNLIEVNGRRVFLDCYSATEDSMNTAMAAADSLSVSPRGKKIIVLGDIPDLDAKTKEIHENVGRQAHNATSVDEIIFYGALMADAVPFAEGGKAHIRHTTSRRQLETWLSETKRRDVVIFKASHKMELHRVADDWLGTCFNLEDIREGVIGREISGGIVYRCIEDYGAYAMELRDIRKKITTLETAKGMPVRAINNKAFEGSIITEAVLSEPLVTIGKDAFSGCKNLKTVSLPRSLFYIGIGAFRDCSALREIEIQRGCATIDANAFAGCTSLKRVKIPRSVLTIGEGAFDADCTATFECIRDSYAEKVIRKMCPNAKIVLSDMKSIFNPAKVRMDIEKFTEEDKIYLAGMNNIYSEIVRRGETVEEVKKRAEAGMAAAIAKKAAAAVSESETDAVVKKTGNTASKNAKRVMPCERPISGNAKGGELYVGKVAESHPKAVPAKKVLTPSEIPAGAKVQKITVTAIGDNTLGLNHKMSKKGSWNEIFEKKGPEFFLKNVSKVFKESDLAIANLEGVLSDDAPRQLDFYRQRGKREQDKVYCHLGKPEYLEALTKGGINAVSFANNHNIDYGVQGFADTIAACRKYDLPVAYYDTIVRKKIGDITVGIVSADFTYVDDQIGEGFLRKAMADARRDCQLIIACMHWGDNYQTAPRPNQVRLAHLVVDLGADMVVGCHAHILQGVERYKGRYIYHSLGNFTYGGRGTPKEIETMIAKQTFTFVNGQLVLDDEAYVVPCWMSSRKDINDFAPIVKVGREGDDVISLINQRSECLGTAFDESGRSKLEPETDIELPAQVDVYDESVPAIIYTLINGLQ